MTRPSPNYRNLEIAYVISTIETLVSRIGERFASSGLKGQAEYLLTVARRTEAQIQGISRPVYGLRLVSGLLILLVFIALVGLLRTLRLNVGDVTLLEFLQALEAGTNELLLLGALLFFIVTIESRIKRKWALAAMHELRSLAHIIDMLQLTKDPERISPGKHDTPSSPKNELSAFELGRYLDYCSELLALIGKLAALYGQNLSDPVTLAAVNEIETLTTGFSRKIWQKLMILNMQKA